MTTDDYLGMVVSASLVTLIAWAWLWETRSAETKDRIMLGCAMVMITVMFAILLFMIVYPWAKWIWSMCC